MSTTFPRTTVGGLSLSRMIIGTNWILGYSHTGAAADGMIRRHHHDAQATADLLVAYLERGVDTIMGPLAEKPVLHEAFRRAEEKAGRKLILIDTPPINVDDNPAARKEAEAVIDKSRAAGCAFCFPHHQSVEQLVNKNKRSIDRLPDYLKMIRDRGMVPGLSAHMPEVLLYSDANGYDVETYIQIFNCTGFLMQIEVEYIQRVIWNAKKPVMTIKPMAAGRVTPLVGLTFSWNAIRPIDLVTVGAMTPDEAAEDIEISNAIFEKRLPNLAGRSSPKKSELMK